MKQLGFGGAWEGRILLHRPWMWNIASVERFLE